VNPWEAHQWPTPPGYPPPPARPRPMDYPPRQSWPGRGIAVTTIVLSGVNAGLGLLALVPVLFFSLMLAPWVLAGPDEPPVGSAPYDAAPGLRVLGVWVLIHATPFLCYSVLFIAAAILLLRHKLIGRRLVVAASLLEIAVFAAFWAGLHAKMGDEGLTFPAGWGWAVGIVIATATMICALLPGTRRWCTGPPSHPRWQ
jgi:hypothetical protein